MYYVHGWQTVTTYFRFFAVDVLPQYDKVLYLDCDITILGDVGELYDIDIGNNLLGGVVIFRNKPHEIEAKAEYLMNTFGITPNEFINAGILSMNLKQFREENIKEKCIAYLQEHRNLKWMDQDALNGVCKGRIHYISEKWNKSQIYADADLVEKGTIGDTAIIHYLDRFKPWWVPFRPSHLYFYQYALLTPYRDELSQAILNNNKQPEEKNEERNEPNNHLVEEPIVPNNEVPEMDDWQILASFERLCEDRFIGPRYLLRCALIWMYGRINRFFQKLLK